MTKNNKEKKGKLSKVLPILLLFILIGILGFLVYEVKFAEKSIFDKGDKYEEYDPNYSIEDDVSNEQQSKPQETSNIIAGITSNVTSNIVKTSNATSSNKVSNIVSNNTSNKVSSTSNKTNTTNKKDTTIPVVSGFSVTTYDKKVVITSVTCSDNVTSSSKLKKEYSKDGGKTWQSSNTLTGLSPATKYTVSVRVTDEAGNISKQYNKSVATKTESVPDDISGIYQSYKVFQLSKSEVAINGSFILNISKESDIIKAGKYENKGYSFYSDRLTINNNIHVLSYKKEGKYTATQAFKDTFDNKTFISNTLCNGVYKGNNGYLYFVGYKDTTGKESCMLFVDVKAGKGLISVQPKINADSIVFGRGGQYGTYWYSNCKFSGNSVTCTNEANAEDKDNIGNKTGGTYTKQRKLTETDAIRAKLTLVK